MNRLGLRLSPSHVARLVSGNRLAHSRYIHVRKELQYPVENGLGDFLPAETLRLLAVDYQDGLLSRLNDEVKGESYICTIGTTPFMLTMVSVPCQGPSRNTKVLHKL